MMGDCDCGLDAVSDEIQLAVTEMRAAAVQIQKAHTLLQEHPFIQFERAMDGGKP